MPNPLPVPPRDVVTITTVSTVAIKVGDVMLGELVIREDGRPRHATDLNYALRNSGYSVTVTVRQTWTDKTALEAMDHQGAAAATNARKYLESRLDGYSVDESNSQTGPYTI